MCVLKLYSKTRHLLKWKINSKSKNRYVSTGEGEYLIKNLDTPEINEKTREFVAKSSWKGHFSVNWKGYLAGAAAVTALGTVLFAKNRN